MALNQGAIVFMAATMVVLVVTNVFCRYVLGFSLVWAEEVSQYLMVWVAFLGAGLALREGRHVAVEMLQERLPDGPRRATRWVILVAVLLFLLATAVLGAQFAWFARDMETPVLNISMAIPYSAVPIGCALLAAHLAFVARDFVQGIHEIPESLEAHVNEGAI